MDEILQKYIFDELGIDSVRFINGQNVSTVSSDIDIYCVTDDTRTSSVHIFQHGDEWVEIFIDNWSDMVNKITNADEICVGFIKDMDNILGESYLLSAKELIPNEFRLPKRRLNLIYYRVKVLYSKYVAVKSPQAKNYFKGLILQQFFMLAFHYSGVWPKSPKKWYDQIENINNEFVKDVINCQDDDRIFSNICNQESAKFKGISMSKQSDDNQITFLG